CAPATGKRPCGVLMVPPFLSDTDQLRPFGERNRPWRARRSRRSCFFASLTARASALAALRASFAAALMAFCMSFSMLMFIVFSDSLVRRVLCFVVLSLQGA